jgi:hypothetical protein
MTLILPDGQPFATGATAYHYRPATAQETTPRLVLEVAIDGIVTQAMVDTGGLYLVCHPGLATQLHLEPSRRSVGHGRSSSVGSSCRAASIGSR